MKLISYMMGFTETLNRMKGSSCLLIFSLGLLIALPLVYADMLYLKNGRSLEGFVKSEDEFGVELEFKGGTVRFNKNQIERISKSTPQESEAIRKRWEKEKIDSQARMRKLQLEEERKPKEIEFSRENQSIVLDVTLNKKLECRFVLDTGASMVILAKKTAEKLGIDLDKVKPDMKLQLGDGRKIDAKHIVLKNVQVQDAEAKDIDASVMLDEVSDFGFGDGLLGMSFLKKFNFKVDLKNRRLILEKL